MSDLLTAILGTGAAALGGGLDAKRRNTARSDRLNQGKMAQALQMAGMMQDQIQNDQTQARLRDQATQTQSNWDAATKTNEARYNEEQNTLRLEQERDFMDQRMEREAGTNISYDKVKAALILAAQRDPTIANSPVFKAVFPGGSGGDPNITTNRALDQRKKVKGLIGGQIQSQRNREFYEALDAGVPYDKDIEAFTTPKPELGTGWGGPSPYPNPAVGAKKQFDYWDSSNPAAQDSAAVLEGISPLFKDLFRGGQPAAITGSSPNNAKAINLSKVDKEAVDDILAYRKTKPGAKINWTKLQQDNPDLNWEAIMSTLK